MSSGIATWAERNRPSSAEAEIIVPASTLSWDEDAERKPGQSGMRKVCVTDWNGDGKLDILLGDICGGHVGKAPQTDDEKHEEARARTELPRLREKWEATYQDYRDLLRNIATGQSQGAEDERKAADLHAAMNRIKEEIIAVQKTQSMYKPRYQYHGFVWLFLRN